MSSGILEGWGRDRVHIDLPIPLMVPIGSFFQANRHLVQGLFLQVMELVGPGTEQVYDLHGGVGFLAAAARTAGRQLLTLVEPHEAGAEAALINLPGAQIVNDTAEAFIGSAVDLEPEATVITDPPRAGMSSELRRQLLTWRPHRLLTIGCDPATWSRDAAFFLDNGYSLLSLELVDLFPLTHHVEVLALLETR
jgi:tRNA/tmRNA/rRNA uracil-C5-methylase (TrmA/RlmC/RlmD family)